MLNPMDGELGIGLFGMLGFVILRRVGEREQVILFAKDVGLRLGWVSFLSFRLVLLVLHAHHLLTSLGQMTAVKATLPVHFRHGMQWQKVS